MGIQLLIFDIQSFILFFMSKYLCKKKNYVQVL